MANISASKAIIEKAMGRSASAEELEKALPNVKCVVEKMEGDALELEITADRPDLLSSAGVGIALRAWLDGKDFALKPAAAVQKITVDGKLKGVRPFIVSAIAHDVPMDDAYLRELIQMQEKLHLTHGRNRRRVAIGLHDAKPLVGPFFYKNATGKEKFIPLGMTEEKTLEEILLQHEKGKAYAHLASKGFPLLTDSKGQVLSFPPIINGVLTQVTTSTRDVFIDITGDDLEACNTALCIVCNDFAVQGARIESVRVEYDDDSLVTPLLAERPMRIAIAYANSILGTSMTAEEAAKLLARQGIKAIAERENVLAAIPRYRADFLHPVDLAEELALARGYDAFEPAKSHVLTTGALSAETVAEGKAKDALIGAGFLEASTYLLTSKETLSKASSDANPAELVNPMTAEYAVVRPELAAQLLSMLSKNTHREYPQRLFEIGETIHADKTAWVHVCGVSAHAEAGMTEAANALDFALKALGRKYVLKPVANERFISGRAADILVDGSKAGSIGELHPRVLSSFGLAVPCAVFEFALMPSGMQLEKTRD